MATRARFGRLPRQAPSLTSTIVALANEYQRVRESNIVDAWKNGGEFEGHRVTDKMVMDWFKKRRADISPDDPMWDYYDNQITQYEFAIENSKMELKYKRGDVSDTGMANFYHKWAGKLPPDSEAYREREKLAAGYEDRAKSGRAASGRAASDKAYAAGIQRNYKREFAYDAIGTFLLSEAVNRGILKGDESLENIDPNTADGREINRLWDEIANSPEYADERKHYTRQIKENGDPNFNGDFSQNNFNAQGRTKAAGVADRIRMARKAGRKGDITAFEKEQGAVRGTKIVTEGFDETEAYEEAHRTWLAATTPASATPLDIDAANQKYIADLNKIKKGLEATLRPGEVDQRLGAVNNELRTMAGDEAPVEHWGGMFGPGENEGGVNAVETAQEVNRNKLAIEQLTERDANGQPVWVLSKTFNGAPVATNDTNHEGAQWRPVRRDQISPDATFVVQAATNGDPRSGKIVTAVTPTPIHVLTDIRDPETGAITKKTGDTPAGYHFTLPDGKTIYKFKDGGGVWQFTPDNPFVTATRNADGSTTYGENPITVDSKSATINVPGNGVVVPSASAVIGPTYYNPSANIAKTDRLGKSGYSAWLIASDPKDRAAYTAKPEDILTSLSLEAGNDPVRLREMVVDADEQRAVYLGTSTPEQNRTRRNAINGTPNPVPLSSIMTKVGAGRSEEARVVAGLTKNRSRHELIGDIKGSETAEPVAADGKSDTDNLLRKFNIAPTPPKTDGKGPFGIQAGTKAPTSMGQDLPGVIAQGLGSIVGGLFGPQSPIAAIAAAPRVAGPTKPYSGIGVPPPASAPKATPAKPTPAAPPPKPPDRREKDDVYTPKAPKVIAPAASAGALKKNAKGQVIGGPTSW